MHHDVEHHDVEGAVVPSRQAVCARYGFKARISEEVTNGRESEMKLFR